MVLVIIGFCTFLFVHRVLDIVEMTGVEPSATVTGFFAFVTAECAILWRMHESKKKREKDEELSEELYTDNINDIGEG